MRYEPSWPVIPVTRAILGLISPLTVVVEADRGWSDSDAIDG